MSYQPIDGLEEILDQESELSFESEEQRLWQNYVLEEVQAVYKSFTKERIGENDSFLDNLKIDEFRGLVDQICCGFYVKSPSELTKTSTPGNLANYISKTITQEQYDQEENGNYESELAGLGLLAA